MSRRYNTETDAIYKQIVRYLTEDDVYQYVDAINVNQDITVNDILDYNSTVSICPGTNEGYYIDIELMDTLPHTHMCAIRTHDDLNNALKIHSSITRRFIR